MNNGQISTILKSVNVSVFIGAGIWVCLVLAAAYRLSKHTSSSTESIAFGPLTLTQLTTEVIPQGPTTVSFSLEYGLLLYILFLIATGIGCGALCLRRNKL